MSEKYVHPNGKGSLFINSYKKEGDNQPAYKGTGTTIDGKQIEIAAWKGQTQNGDEKLSLQFSEPYVKPEEKSTPSEKKEDDDLGF
tara:strand:+ start:3166 stop:3423 length:258 start_codon:yes stop_codon:yes gene_type:complete